MWDIVADTLAQEFSELSNPADLTRVIARVFLAVVLAAVVGYDREQRGTGAGLRTHMMLALGVSLLAVSAQQAGMDEDGVSRVIQGVFAGLGFLGAGAILKQRGRDEVRGLTTAATLWSTAAIATAAGLGREATAVIATIFAWGILAVLLRVQRRETDARDT